MEVLWYSDIFDALHVGGKVKAEMFKHVTAIIWKIFVRIINI